MHVCVHRHISGLMHASGTKFLQLYQYERIEVLYRYYASTRKLVTAVSMGTGILTDPGLDVCWYRSGWVGQWSYLGTWMGIQLDRILGT